MAEQGIKKKEKGIKKVNPGIGYASQADSLSKVQTKYKPVMTKSDYFKDSINKNILRLQSANADPSQIQANVSKQNPNSNWFLDFLNYLGRPAIGVTAGIASIFSQGNQQMMNELGVDNPFDAFAQVLTEGNLKAYEARDEMFSGANMLQAISGKTTSTKDWSNASKIIGSLATEIVLDPMNIAIPLVAKNVAEGVGYGYNQGKKMLNIKSKADKKLISIKKEMMAKGTPMTEQGIIEYAQSQLARGETYAGASSTLKTLGNSLGLSSAEMKRTNEIFSTMEVLKGKAQNATTKDWRKITKDINGTLKRAMKGESNVATESLVEDMKRVGVLNDEVTLDALNTNKRLAADTVMDYMTDLHSRQIEQHFNSPSEFINDLLRYDIDNASGKDKSIWASPEGIDSPNIPDAISYKGTRWQLDNQINQLRQWGLVPEDPNLLSDYVKIRNVGELDNPLFNLAGTTKFRKNFEEVNKAFLDADVINSPQFLKMIETRENLRMAVSKYYTRRGILDPTQNRKVQEAITFIRKYMNGEKGAKISSWTKMRPGVMKGAPKLAKAVDDVLAAQLKLQSSQVASVVKKNMSRGQISAKGKKELKKALKKSIKSKKFPDYQAQKDLKILVNNHFKRSKNYTKRKQAYDIRQWQKLRPKIVSETPELAKKVDNLFYADFTIPEPVISNLVEKGAQQGKAYDDLLKSKAFKEGVEESVDESLIPPAKDVKKPIEKDADLFVPKKTKNVGNLQATEGLDPSFNGYNIGVSKKIDKKLLDKFAKNNKNVGFFRESDNFLMYRNRGLEQVNKLAFKSFMTSLTKRLKSIDPNVKVVSKWVPGNSQQTVVITSKKISSQGSNNLVLRFTEPSTAVNPFAQLKSIDNVGISIPYYSDVYTFKEELGKNFENIMDLVQENMGITKADEAIQAPWPKLETPLTSTTPIEPRPSIKEVVEKKYKPLK